MGFDCGFDISPKLSADVDREIYAEFVNKIIETYQDTLDENSRCENHKILQTPRDLSCDDKQNICFMIGEYPRIPFNPDHCGHFLRFSSKVSGRLTAPAEKYIRDVCRIAKGFFGSRVHFWHELNETDDERQYGKYDWKEVHDASKTLEEHSAISLAKEGEPSLCAPEDGRVHHCPAFGELPGEHDLDLDYYETSNGYSYRPRRHWCFLGEISSIDDFMRIRLWVQDKAGVEIPVSFYTEGRGYDIPAGSVKKGNTVAILYAEQHPFLDLSVGIRVEDVSSVKIFGKPLNKISGLLKQTDDHRNACAQCDAVAKGLPKCGRCNAVRYCNKDCQTTAWKNGHKNECILIRRADFQVLMKLDQPVREEFLAFSPS